MGINNYDPSTALTSYYISRDERRPARLWATEKLLHDMAALGMLAFFEGPGTNPTSLDGYATTKLWLRVSSGVTDQPGEVRAYDGSGDATLVASWPEMTPGAFLSFIGVNPQIGAFEDRAGVQLASINVAINGLMTLGYNAVGDGGAGSYKRVESEPTHPGKVQSADGAWWELVDAVVYPGILGAVGNGSTDDTAAFTATRTIVEADDAPIHLDRKTYALGTTEPDYDVIGDGRIVANGVTAGGGALRHNPARETIFFNPSTYQREVQEITYPPPRGADYITSSYNVVFALGSALDDRSKNIRYTSAYGYLVGSAPGAWGYVDAFGGSAMAYAHNVERTTAVGSETLAWFGAPDQEWMRTYRHDWWRKPADNPYEPGEVGWDSYGLETLFAGIGERLAAYTDYAEDSTEAGFVTAVGRDAGNHIVKGIRNVFVGYGAGQNVFEGSYLTAIGALAMRNCVFGEANVGVGDQAGMNCLDSTNATFLGYAAGRTVEDGTSAVIIGDRAADLVTSAERSVIIGALAGASHPTDLDDMLVISNTRSTTRDPLISGRFDDEVAGVAIQPESLRAKWHVQGAASGSSLAPENGILVEGSTIAALTLETTNTGFPQILFADPESKNVGAIVYGHGSNALTFSANSTECVRCESTGIFVPRADNSRSNGRAAFRWSEIFAGNGTINTSDAREKDWRGPVTDAEQRVAVALSRLVGLYRWKKSVAVKGENARLHIGVTAQDVQQAFAAEGLDGRQYGVVCYDEWDDAYEAQPDGTERLDVAAGNRWGIRYDQLNVWIAAGLDARLNTMEMTFGAH